MVDLRADRTPPGGAGGVLSLETLGYIGEFVGGMVVVFSLVYLARQVQQNTRSLRTENYARALERVSVTQSRLSSDAALSDVFGRGVLCAEALTREERIQFSWAFYEMFGAFEFMYHQAEAGALPEEVWKRWAGTLAWWISLPGVRAWWRARPTPFTESFSKLVDGYLADSPVDREAAVRFGEFLNGPPPPG